MSDDGGDADFVDGLRVLSPCRGGWQAAIWVTSYGKRILHFIRSTGIKWMFFIVLVVWHEIC